MPKIQGGLSVANLKKTRGDPYYQFSKFESPEKKQGGTFTTNFQNLSHLKKSNKGDPYYQFSKFESLEKKVRVLPCVLEKLMKKSNLKIQKNKGGLSVSGGGLSVGNATDLLKFPIML